MAPPIIHVDYDFSPYGQKTKLLLHASGVSFKKLDVPAVLPRKDLEALGITYRRIPLLAVGKDIYLDSSKIQQITVSTLGSIPQSPADKAYQTWGDTVFNEVLGLIPQQILSPDFVKDRETVFPIVKRPDLATIRPSALAGFQSRLREIEEDFLGKSQGPFINGEKISMADVHVAWAVRWALNDLGAGKDKGCGKEDFPKVYRLIESLPDVKPEVLSAEEAHKAIRESEYSASGPTSVMKDEALGLEAGTQVTIESFDSTPGAHPQAGKLVGTSIDEVVIEVTDGIRLHFPKIGYIVRAQ
ncbi:glutathione s-transferase like protein [Zymoseptoria brevis]|uniref:Glutathione s-transferase like protein n=1 Tax=Zymoseptoria brevis TaxID=1047168 RepID=A0A0F4GST2_9PEZI|nr:glutathione s-transferase like protein [Zymoseptoria brevis]